MKSFFMSKKFVIAATSFTALTVVGFMSHSSQKETASLASTEKIGQDLTLPDYKKADLKNVPKEDNHVIMNDSALKQAWGLNKVDAQKAWKVSVGSKKVVVAIIDTGADIHHEDLAKNIWVNPGETGLDSKGHDKSNNQIDDDGNGYIDDVHGWNFVSNNSDLTDNHGHGTHIAGIIGAEGGNGKGIAGVAPQVSLMILKYYDPKVAKTDNLKNTVNALKYAVQQKVNIINYSGGGTEYSQEEKDAIESARKQGILVVAAAGNERSNSDKYKYYPADYGLSNIISVTAIDPNTEVLPSSNYGTATVDIAAPGQNILSTLPNNAYGYMTGTSQATAFVTGAAVLVMASKNNMNPDDTKKYILATGDQQLNLMEKTRTYRKLNLYKALTKLDSGENLRGVAAANIAQIQVPSVSAVSENQENSAVVGQFGRDLMKTVQSASLNN